MKRYSHMMWQTAHDCLCPFTASLISAVRLRVPPNRDLQGDAPHAART